MVEEDTWEKLENLGNLMDLVEEFEKKIRKEEHKWEKKRGRKRYWNWRSIQWRFCLGKTIRSLKINIWRSWREVGKRKRSKFLWRWNINGGYCHGISELLYFIFIFFFFYLFSLIFLFLFILFYFYFLDNEESHDHGHIICHVMWCYKFRT